MRKVAVYEYIFTNKGRERRFNYYAKFHEFGTDYEEFEDGPGNFSTAILEREDGTIKNVPVELISFIDK